MRHRLNPFARALGVWVSWWFREVHSPVAFYMAWELHMPASQLDWLGSKNSNIMIWNHHNPTTIAAVLLLLLLLVIVVVVVIASNSSKQQAATVVIIKLVISNCGGRRKIAFLLFCGFASFSSTKVFGFYQ